jgi:hypothetical protein
MCASRIVREGVSVTYGWSGEEAGNRGPWSPCGAMQQQRTAKMRRAPKMRRAATTVEPSRAAGQMWRVVAATLKSVLAHAHNLLALHQIHGRDGEPPGYTYEKNLRKDLYALTCHSTWNPRRSIRTQKNNLQFPIPSLPRKYTTGRRRRERRCLSWRRERIVSLGGVSGKVPVRLQISTKGNWSILFDHRKCNKIIQSTRTVQIIEFYLHMAASYLF